jgi:HEAT repeat protein
MPIRMHLLPLAAVAALFCPSAVAQDDKLAAPNATQAPNPYRLDPFHADFPVELEYPPQVAREYVGTRRQILERLAANLTGNVRREAWQIATEFFWQAPEDAVEPLIEAMDRSFGKDGLDDAVKNCIEAMARMGNDAFDSALRRALHHKNPNVQQAAFAAIGTSGKLDTLREIGAAFPHMDGRARGAWLRAVRVRLPLDEAVKLLTSVMMGNYPTHVRDEVLKEAMRLPMTAAAQVLRGRWPDAVGEFKAIVAGVLHAAGDETGTVWLRDSFAGEDLERLVYAIRHCAYGEPGVLREPLLRASTHLRAEVRLEVARVLVRVSGDDVADVYEVLAAPEEPWETRSIALRELTRRGRPKLVTALLEELPTAEGTRLKAVINQLSASGDPRAVPVLLDRLAKAPVGESRPFVQALAQNSTEAAAKALFELYRGPETLIGRGSRELLTTRNYLPMLFLNLRGSERVVLAEFLALPKADWSLRAPLVPTIAGIAADRNDPQIQATFIAAVREILFDRTELPQMRVLALNQLAKRWLTIDDVLRLKSMYRDEAAGLRALFADFLDDAF